MKNMIGNTEEILSRGIYGFHQYILSDPVRISFASNGLCEMLEVTEKELVNAKKDLYENFVHADDRKSYREFLKKLAASAQTLSLEYRLVKKDGSVIYVKDTSTSEKCRGGIMTCCSVLADITALKTDTGDLHFINESTPCGLVTFTCENQPKITYANKNLLEILRFPKIKDGEIDYYDLYKSNIYLMIPMENRRSVALYLNRVYTQNKPAIGEFTVFRCDGTKAYLFGCVMKCRGESGQDEFWCICMDMTEKYYMKRAGETNRYLKALTAVYDKIFEYDLSNNTVKCLYRRNASPDSLQSIPMQMEDATDGWILDEVIEEDREGLRNFFAEMFRGESAESDSPPQICYKTVSKDGRIVSNTGIILKIDNSAVLFCSKKIADSGETDLLRSENSSLKSINRNMHDIVMHFTDGIAAFEVTDGENVKPLYASDNVCNFFGFSKEEWLSLMQKGSSIENFIRNSSITYEDFRRLLDSGESEFSYYDIRAGKKRLIKAVCSPAQSGGNTRHVMLYSDGRHDIPGGRNIFIRTFGYFDVFVNERPIAFRSQKSKELFALLVDHRGGYVSSKEAIGFLWENDPVDSMTLARYRKVALRLKNLLEEYGIADIVESVNGKRRIVTEKVRCDLYDYLSGKEEFSQLFRGSYLTNYSWGETTLGELTNEHNF